MVTFFFHCLLLVPGNMWITMTRQEMQLDGRKRIVKPLFRSFFLFFERRRAVELQAREGKGREEEEEEGAGEEGDPRPAFESKIGRVPRVVTGIFP